MGIAYAYLTSACSVALCSENLGLTGGNTANPGGGPPVISRLKQDDITQTRLHFEVLFYKNLVELFHRDSHIHTNYL